MDDTDRSGWRDIVASIEHLPDEISDWCFAPFADDWTGDKKVYQEIVAPFKFLNLKIFRNRLNHYKRNRDALVEFNTILNNGLRFIWDPLLKGKDFHFRANVVAIIMHFNQQLFARSTIVQKIKQEGSAFIPYWSAFPGASTVIATLEKFHEQNIKDTYFIFYREGLYSSDGNYSDPSDYFDYCPHPVFLSDIFERLYLGLFRSPTKDNRTRVMYGYYSSPEEVNADVERMFKNARYYHEDDQEIVDRVDRMWSAWRALWAQQAAGLAIAVKDEAQEVERILKDAGSTVPVPVEPVQLSSPASLASFEQTQTAPETVPVQQDPESEHDMEDIYLANKYGNKANRNRVRRSLARNNPATPQPPLFPPNSVESYSFPDYSNATATPPPFSAAGASSQSNPPSLLRLSFRRTATGAGNDTPKATGSETPRSLLSLTSTSLQQAAAPSPDVDTKPIISPDVNATVAGHANAGAHAFFSSPQMPVATATSHDVNQFHAFAPTVPSTLTVVGTPEPTPQTDSLVDPQGGPHTNLTTASAPPLPQVDTLSSSTSLFPDLDSSDFLSSLEKVVHTPLAPNSDILSTNPSSSTSTTTSASVATNLPAVDTTASSASIDPLLSLPDFDYLIQLPIDSLGSSTPFTPSTAGSDTGRTPVAPYESSTASYSYAQPTALQAPSNTFRPQDTSLQAQQLAASRGTKKLSVKKKQMLSQLKKPMTHGISSNYVRDYAAAMNVPPLPDVIPTGIDYGPALKSMVKTLRECREKSPITGKEIILGAIFDKKVEIPGYDDIIAQPMWTQEIDRRLRNHYYNLLPDPTAVRRDLDLIGYNCLQYNKGNAEYETFGNMWLARVEIEFRKAIHKAVAQHESLKKRMANARFQNTIFQAGVNTPFASKRSGDDTEVTELATLPEYDTNVPAAPEVDSLSSIAFTYAHQRMIHQEIVKKLQAHPLQALLNNQYTALPMYEIPIQRLQEAGQRVSPFTLSHFEEEISKRMSGFSTLADAMSFLYLLAQNAVDLHSKEIWRGGIGDIIWGRGVKGRAVARMYDEALYLRKLLQYRATEILGDLAKEEWLKRQEQRPIIDQEILDESVTTATRDTLLEAIRRVRGYRVPALKSYSKYFLAPMHQVWNKYFKDVAFPTEYFSWVKRPLCLEVISLKLSRSALEESSEGDKTLDAAPYRTHREFYDDMELLWANAECFWRELRARGVLSGPLLSAAQDLVVCARQLRAEWRVIWSDAAITIYDSIKVNEIVMNEEEQERRDNQDILKKLEAQVRHSLQKDKKIGIDIQELNISLLNRIIMTGNHDNIPIDFLCDKEEEPHSKLTKQTATSLGSSNPPQSQYSGAMFAQFSELLRTGKQQSTVSSQIAKWTTYFTLGYDKYKHLPNPIEESFTYPLESKVTEKSKMGKDSTDREALKRKRRDESLLVKNHTNSLVHSLALLTQGRKIHDSKLSNILGMDSVQVDSISALVKRDVLQQNNAYATTYLPNWYVPVVSDDNNIIMPDARCTATANSGSQSTLQVQKSQPSESSPEEPERPSNGDDSLAYVQSHAGRKRQLPSSLAPDSATIKKSKLADVLSRMRSLKSVRAS